jgi:hypothetical protein
MGTSVKIERAHSVNVCVSSISPNAYSGHRVTNRRSLTSGLTRLSVAGRVAFAIASPRSFVSDAYTWNMPPSTPPAPVAAAAASGTTSVAVTSNRVPGSRTRARRSALSEMVAGASAVGFVNAAGERRYARFSSERKDADATGALDVTSKISS